MISLPVWGTLWPFPAAIPTTAGTGIGGAGRPDTAGVPAEPHAHPVP